MSFIKKLLGNFAELTRAYALPVTLASCLIIWAFAYTYYGDNIEFTYKRFALLVFALCCVHLGANLFDDYIDVKHKLKTAGALDKISFERYTLKANLILNGTFSLKEVLLVISILFFIPTVIGIYFALTSSIYVLLYAFLGGVLALFYPIASKYYLGEVVIGSIYGPLMINGGYLAMTGSYHYGLFWCSIAVFFTTIVLLHTDNIMDWEHDTKEGKKTLCLLLKSKQKAIKWLFYIIAISYIIILAAVLLDCLNKNSLYVFLTLPIAVELLRSLVDYINIKDVEFKPRWYYGFFENWKKIQEAKIDFFMYRMYLGRNYLFFFALFLAIGTVV